MIRKRTADRSIHRGQRSTLWQKCTNFRAIKQIHAFMVVNGFNSNRSSLRELIFVSAVAISGTIEYAHQVFALITDPDTFMCNSMIRGSVQSLNSLKAMKYYALMEKWHVKPDNFTFPFVLKACTKLSWVNMGFGIHGKVMKFGFDSNTFARNTLIFFHANCGDLKIASSLFDDLAKTDIVPWSALTAGYARRGQLSVARRLFDEMPIRDLVSWNVMITGYAKKGEMESARELFEKVPNRDVVTWNAMIAGYVNCGLHDQALELFRDMDREGEQPDEVTMLSLLSACAGIGDLDIGKKLHSKILDLCSGELSTLLGNTLIDMYAKCGSPVRALEVFRKTRHKDVSTWNSIIGGLAFHGHSEESIKLFENMQQTTICPDAITFVGVLVACSHAGKVDEGRQYFNLMRDKFRIEPNVRHYGCMTDMFGRAGLLTEAFEFINKMEIEPNGIIWRTLLGACKIHGNIELAKRANDQLLKLRRDQSGDYVLLCNLYASQGEWDGVEKLRKLMDDSGARKERGYSLVEADGKVLSLSI